MKDIPLAESFEQEKGFIPEAVFPGSTFEYLKSLFAGFTSLLQGMGVTLSYFVNPAKIVTQQYPENRADLQMFDRFRGRLVMEFTEDGHPRCSGCSMCEKACPNGAISVLPTKGHDGKRILGRYQYRFSQCTLCNLCVESCQFGAIRMGQDFELASYDRQSLDLSLYDREEVSL